MVESEAGWKPDPLGRYTYRWWSGTAWTDQVHQGSGASLVDPMGLHPGPRAVGTMPPAPALPGSALTGTTTPGSASPDATSPGSPSPANTGWSPLDATSSQPIHGYNAGYAAGNGFGANPGYQYPPNQYPPDQYGQMPPQLVVTNATKSPGIAVASLVLGVGSLCVAVLPFIGLVSLPFSFVGLVLGFAGLSRAKKGFEGHGIAVAGVITSALALIIPILWIVLFAFAFDDSTTTLDQINSDVSNGICDDSRYLEDPDC